jgi:predicted MFS family arabinose efflux permease
MIGKVVNSYKSSFRGLSREAWLLSLVMLVNRAGTMAVPFMSLYVTVKLGRSLADAGLIITLFGVGSVMGALLGGFLTDRVGFRMVQVIAAMASGAMFIFYGFITDFTLLCILTVFLSLVADALRPANHAAIANYSTPENLTRTYTLNRLAINLGWSLGGAIGGILAAIDYQLLFWVEGLTNIMAGIMIWILLPNTRQPGKKISLKSSKPPGVKQPWQDALFMRFIFFATLFTTAFFLVFRLVPVFWRTEWQIDERGIGILLGLNGLIIALMEMVLVRRWERKGRNLAFIIYGAMACALAYLILLLPWGTGWTLALLFMLVITLGEMLAFPFIASFIMLRSTEHNRGAYATANTLSWSVAQIIGPSGGGWIAEHFGFPWLWGALILLCLITGAGFYYVWQLQKKTLTVID